MARRGKTSPGREEDLRFMRRALRLASKGLGATSPNPAVGAVIVKAGRVVAEGWHRRAGLPHAEVEALRAAEAAGVKGLEDATMYVTLEPCRHHGRTPPCTGAVIDSGVGRVVVGATDPNPRVSGEGIEELKQAGVEVAAGVLADECASLNEGYNKWVVTGLPFVTLKLASTLDGRTAAYTGDSRWITGPEARRLVHRMRAVHDAVMVGSGTVRADDPELTVRDARGRDPLRVVLDTGLSIPAGARVFGGGEGKGGLVVFSARGADRDKVRMVREAGAEVVFVRKSRGGEGLDPFAVLSALGERGVTSVLSEGGATVAGSLLGAGLVDRVSIFLAPKLVGSDGHPSVGPLGAAKIADALELEDMKTRRVGPDLLVEGRPAGGPGAVTGRKR